MTTTFDLASATGERCRVGLELHAPGVLEVVEGPAELRRRFTGEDWFAATCALRRRAERLGLRALIVGAGADVWPTLRQREEGGLALTRLGRRASKLLEVVGLFEPAPAGRVVSFAQQFLRWRDWLRQPEVQPGRSEARILADRANGEHICVATPANDPRLAFVGSTLGWWRIDYRHNLEPEFRHNPRVVFVAGRSGSKRAAELLYETDQQQVRLRLWGAGLVDAVGRGRDAFVALADLREQIARHGRRLCVQGAVEDAWRRTDDGITVQVVPLGRLPRGGWNRDLLDPAELDEVASVEDQRRRRAMLLGSPYVPSDDVLAWARQEPESWRPSTWKRHGPNGPGIVGWWRSDAWGRVVEFRPNPARNGLAPRDSEVPTGLYPLDGM
jgi:hypothetical protein